MKEALKFASFQGLDMFLEYSNRRFRRYDVSQYESLKSQVSSYGAEKKLVNMSLGGCSFYEVEGSRVLSPREKVLCRFEVDQKEVEVEGRVVYAVNTQVGAEKVVQYGLEFGVSARDSLGSIIEHLDMKSQTGEVRLL